MEQPIIIFIYAKNGLIKALTLEQVKEIGEALIKDGYEHMHTLNACSYLEFLHNDCNKFEVVDEIKSLSIKKRN